MKVLHIKIYVTKLNQYLSLNFYDIRKEQKLRITAKQQSKNK